LSAAPGGSEEENVGEEVEADRCELDGACFVTGTPLLTPDGAKPIEELKEGDLVLSRNEFDPTGPVEARRVLQTFRRSASIWHVHVRGRVIGTTKEHPFYVLGKGWRAAGELEVGDLFLSQDGQWVVVEDLLDTGEVRRVYNVRIADYHTYFVGSREWGFSVWAHNAEGTCGPAEDPLGGRAHADALRDMDYEDALLSPENREFYAKEPGLQEPFDRETHYPDTPTKADRRALGAGPGQVVDHDPPLAKRYYEGDPNIGEPPGRMMTPEERAASAADRSRMRLMDATESARQGQQMQQYAREMAERLGCD
jgi:intein/homing endonuclease